MLAQAGSVQPPATSTAPDSRLSAEWKKRPTVSSPARDQVREPRSNVSDSRSTVRQAGRVRSPLHTEAEQPPVASTRPEGSTLAAA